MKLTENDKEELIRYGSMTAVIAFCIIVLLVTLKVREYTEKHTTYYRTDDFTITYNPPAGRSGGDLDLTWTDFNGDTHTNTELIFLFNSVYTRDTENYIVYTDKFELKELHLTEETSRKIGMIRDKSASFGEYDKND